MGSRRIEEHILQSTRIMMSRDLARERTHAPRHDAQEKCEATTENCTRVREKSFMCQICRSAYPGQHDASHGHLSSTNVCEVAQQLHPKEQVASEKAFTHMPCAPFKSGRSGGGCSNTMYLDPTQGGTTKRVVTVMAKVSLIMW